MLGAIRAASAALLCQATTHLLTRPHTCTSSSSQVVLGGRLGKARPPSGCTATCTSRLAHTAARLPRAHALRARKWLCTRAGVPAGGYNKTARHTRLACMLLATNYPMPGSSYHIQW